MQPIKQKLSIFPNASNFTVTSNVFETENQHFFNGINLLFKINTFFDGKT